MSLKEQDIQEIYDKMKPLIGKRAWNIERTWGSFITFEIGHIVSVSEDVTRSEWLLSIRHCVWRLQTSDDVICGSEDPHDHMDPALKRLENLAFLAFEIFHPSLEMTISFELGLFLRLFPIYTYEEDFEHVVLFTPDHHFLKLGPGSNWVYRRSDVPGR